MAILSTGDVVTFTEKSLEMVSDNLSKVKAPNCPYSVDELSCLVGKSGVVVMTYSWCSDVSVDIEGITFHMDSSYFF